MNAIITTDPTVDTFSHLIERTDLQPTTKAQYIKAIRNAVNEDVNLADSEQVKEYAATLKKSSRAFLKSALRLWSKEIESQAKGSATPDNIAAVQATVYRVEALNDAISVSQTKGTKAHTWLTQAQVRELSRFCDGDDLRCQRDRVVLALLVGAGLRRAELATLRFDALIHQPVNGKLRLSLNIQGKGDKARTVPLADHIAAILDAWHGPTGGMGFVARSITKGGALGDSISPQGIFGIVAKAGAAIGKPELAPHDLRRTYAQLGYEAGVPVTQISRLLGHSSIETTQKYLNLELNLESTVSDFIPFG